ncbi:hypothetical protein ACFE04_001934 [Oxalis oulophora]
MVNHPSKTHRSQNSTHRFLRVPSSTASPLSLDLLQLITTTLHSTITVAIKWQALTLIEGKLKIQSDIDSVLEYGSKSKRELVCVDVISSLCCWCFEDFKFS